VCHHRDKHSGAAAEAQQRSDETPSVTGELRFQSNSLRLTSSANSANMKDTMPLDATIIRAKLTAASSNTKDNVAQSIINGASVAELKSLDVESVLLLYEALYLMAPRIYSDRDQAAMARLAANTQFQTAATPDFGVGLVRTACAGSPVVQMYLSADLVKRIYAAEKKRLSFAESWGIDGDTIGRGQLGQSAYDDVRAPRNFKAELEKCIAHVQLAKLLAVPGSVTLGIDTGGYKVTIPEQYPKVWPVAALEDFVVAAYAALKMKESSKAGRSLKDAAKFGIARYHGMFSMVAAAQKTAGDEINWAPVEATLRSQGRTDECDYVNEVVI
jgi:hypothetical protein